MAIDGDGEKLLKMNLARSTEKIVSGGLAAATVRMVSSSSTAYGLSSVNQRRPTATTTTMIMITRYNYNIFIVVIIINMRTMSPNTLMCGASTLSCFRTSISRPQNRIEPKQKIMITLLFYRQRS